MAKSVSPNNLSNAAATIALEQRLKQGELHLKAEEAKMAHNAIHRTPDENAASDGLGRRVDAGGKGEGEKRLSGTRPEEITDNSKPNKKHPGQKHGLAVSGKQANKQQVREGKHEALKAQSATASPLHQSLDANGYTRQSGSTKSWSDSLSRNKDAK